MLLIGYINLFTFTFFTAPTTNICAPDFKPRTTILLEDNDLGHTLEPSSEGSLKLLTYLNAASWSTTWMEYISNAETPTFDDSYYHDYFNMRSLANIHKGSNYFYMGYFPGGNIGKGPRYIALFELQYSKRIFNCKQIIQNPKQIDLDSSLVDFKNEIQELTEKSFVFLKYSELKRPEQMKYFLEWRFNVDPSK